MTPPHRGGQPPRSRLGRVGDCDIGVAIVEAAIVSTHIDKQPGDLMLALLPILVTAARPKTIDVAVVTVTEVETGEEVLVISMLTDLGYAFSWGGEAFSIATLGDKDEFLCMRHSSPSSVEVEGLPPGTMPEYLAICRPWNEPDSGVLVPGSDGALEWKFDLVTIPWGGKHSRRRAHIQVPDSGDDGT